MKIDLGQVIVYEVTLGEKTFSLREPTVKDIKKMQDETKTMGENSLEAYLNFLSEIGLPKDVAETMGISKMQMLTESLVSSVGKKN